MWKDFWNPNQPESKKILEIQDPIEEPGKTFEMQILEGSLGKL